MQEDKRELPVRRRDCLRETRNMGGDGHVAAEFRCQSDDHEVEVGCHGATRQRVGKEWRRMLIAIVSGAILVPVLVGLTGKGGHTHALASLLFRQDGRYTASLEYDVIDHLGSKDCSFGALTAWAKGEGIEAEKIQVADLPCSKCQGGTRRGVTAKVPIKKGEAIVRAPWSATINTVLRPSARLEAALEMLRKSTHTSSSNDLALLLMYERFRGDSQLRDYICFLPLDHGGPIHWDDAKLAMLPASDRKLISFFKLNLLLSYNRMFPLLFRKFSSLFHPDVHTPDAWLWAQAMVASRNWHVNRKRFPRIQHAMVPVADLVNHRLREGGGRTDSNGTHFQLVAGSSFVAGEEVFTDYGTHCNMYYLLVYGFEIPGNDINCTSKEFPKVFKDPNAAYLKKGFKKTSWRPRSPPRSRQTKVPTNDTKRPINDKKRPTTDTPRPKMQMHGHMTKKKGKVGDIIY